MHHGLHLAGDEVAKRNFLDPPVWHLSLLLLGLDLREHAHRVLLLKRRVRLFRSFLLVSRQILLDYCLVVAHVLSLNHRVVHDLSHQFLCAFVDLAGQDDTNGTIINIVNSFIFRKII